MKKITDPTSASESQSSLKKITVFVLSSTKTEYNLKNKVNIISYIMLRIIHLRKIPPT